MLHKISDMCNKVDVIHRKSEELRKLKYDTPKDARDNTQIDFLIQDIQTLCREIAYDRGEYNK
jgi:hypothetical protein|tara:strand:+ start:1170 stop:1358 length:189 start_codon:yes stop_codon:yes gene_type:complete